MEVEGAHMISSWLMAGKVAAEEEQGQPVEDLGVVVEEA